MRRSLRIVGWVLLGVIAFVAVGTLLLLYVVPSAVPESDPRPAQDYEEAQERLADLLARDTADIARPTIVFDHGSAVETAVVLFHGYTNNPEQFDVIGKAFYDAGYNVLIPRLPEHGEADLMTRDMSKITAPRLVEATDEAVDIAAGLGERVEVVGLSGGGTLATWAAYDRGEVDSSVIISPLFGVDVMPTWAVRPIAQWFRFLPDVYMWWDPTKKADRVPKDAYPRFSFKSLSAFFQVGFDVGDRDPQREGTLSRAVLITNAADRSVDEAVAARVFEDDIAPFAEEVETYEYPEDLGYSHDIIDPEGTNADHMLDIYEVLYRYLRLPPPTAADFE